MTELLTDLIKLLVDKPEEVVISETKGEDETITLNLKVASQDMGRIIGKEGKIIKALRTLVKTAGFREGKKLYLRVEEEPQEGQNGKEAPAADQSDKDSTPSES